jgi:hypothetical protein
VVSFIRKFFTPRAGGGQPKIVQDAIASSRWMSKALSSSGYRANFSLASLREVDLFIGDHAPDGHPKSGGLLADGLGPRIFGLGCYVGEVIRRAGDGAWEGDDADPEAEINISIKLKNGGLIWPVQRVMKRLQNGAEDGIYAYGVAILNDGLEILNDQL